MHSTVSNCCLSSGGVFNVLTSFNCTGNSELIQASKGAIMCSLSRDESQKRAPRTFLTAMLVGPFQFRILMRVEDSLQVSMGEGDFCGVGGSWRHSLDSPFWKLRCFAEADAWDPEMEVRMLWSVDMEEEQSTKLNCSCSQHHRNLNTAT